MGAHSGISLVRDSGVEVWTVGGCPWLQATIMRTGTASEALDPISREVMIHVSLAVSCGLRFEAGRAFTTIYYQNHCIAASLKEPAR